MEIQSANNRQDSLEGDKKEGRFALLDVKTYHNTNISKRVWYLFNFHIDQWIIIRSSEQIYIFMGTIYDKGGIGDAEQ